MKSRKLFTVLAAALFALGLNYFIIEKWIPQFSNLSTSAHSDTFSKKTNTIQVALLLDTSGSMNGLIEQAKSQLWQILNTLAKTERQGHETTLEIALYEYGNPTYTATQIHQLSPFTNDMDLISKKLFALSTNGGEEYCGEVITTAIKNLEWGTDDSNLKMIYIAGNEPFTQGPINYAEACHLAKKQNIFINTIFCGDYKEGVNGMWRQGAQLADGEYMNINHNQTTVYIETPYDKKIDELNLQLNKTYIPYGNEGKVKKENQITQDLNASVYGKSNCADRAAFKCSKKYTADSWDLVDAYAKDKNIINSASGLPDSLQNITSKELEIKIQTTSSLRTAIKNQIQTLNNNRLIYIQNNSKEDAQGNNLKKSIEKSIQKQAKKKGFKVNEEQFIIEN
ncbi:MAG TPA: VWA domain-containing protein [Phaeodactylibacter sp.]|nr:VWA domain-containing protein [Phaeodactylibacter sp.]